MVRPNCEETLARERRACKYKERAIDVLQGAVVRLALITRVSFSFVQKHFSG